jgi:hypothetical protein
MQRKRRLSHRARLNPEIKLMIEGDYRAAAPAMRAPDWHAQIKLPSLGCSHTDVEMMCDLFPTGENVIGFFGRYHGKSP